MPEQKKEAKNIIERFNEYWNHDNLQGMLDCTSHNFINIIPSVNFGPLIIKRQKLIGQFESAQYWNFLMSTSKKNTH